MSKTIEIPDIAQWEDTDSELAKYTIGKLEEENKELRERFIQALKVAQERFNKIQKAIDYIEYWYVDEEYVKKEAIEKNLDLEKETIECSVEDFIELLHILKGEE